jgi:hypothetical protein
MILKISMYLNQQKVSVFQHLNLKIMYVKQFWISSKNMTEEKIYMNKEIITMRQFQNSSKKLKLFQIVNQIIQLG